MVLTIKTKITTDGNDKRKWALIDSSFTEELIDKWTGAGFDYDSAKKWLGTVSKEARPMEIQNTDFFTWVKTDSGIVIGKATVGGADITPSPSWLANLADWKELKDKYSLFVEDQKQATPKQTATGTYTGTAAKPEARKEFLPRKGKPTLIFAYDKTKNSALQLMPFDLNRPETNTLDDWETDVKVITNVENKKIKDRIKEEIKKVVAKGEGFTKLWTNSGVSPEFGGGKVRYDLLEKKYSLEEVNQMLEDIADEEAKKAWITNQETAHKNTANYSMLWRYSYLLNPTYVYSQTANQRFITWE